MSISGTPKPPDSESQRVTTWDARVEKDPDVEGFAEETSAAGGRAEDLDFDVDVVPLDLAGGAPGRRRVG